MLVPNVAGGFLILWERGCNLLGYVTGEETESRVISKAENVLLYLFIASEAAEKLPIQTRF